MKVLKIVTGLALILYGTYLAFAIIGAGELARIIEREAKENERRIDCHLGKRKDCKGFLQRRRKWLKN